MANTIKEYDAYLTFDPIASEKVERVQQLFREQDLLAEVDGSSIEFEFSGRDLSDYIVKVFIQVAEVVEEASGEVVCEIEDDDYKDPSFKFYSISDGKLWIQNAVISRSEDIVEASWHPSLDE